MGNICMLLFQINLFFSIIKSSVADPDPNPDPLDSHVFGPPGYGSGYTSQRYGSGSGSCSGSGSGSTCFWPSRIRIRIILSSCKNSKKNLDPYYFVTLFDFLSLKNDVNVAS
jgi:hypothetical protein